MRILILGGNGMIGHKIYQILKDTYVDTWVLLRQNLNDLVYKDLFNPDKVIDNVELSELDKLTKYLEKLDPDIIINAAGITLRRGIETVLSKSILINSVLPHFLEEWIIGKNSKRVIHFSTDCVFSGTEGAYTETSNTDARDYYGRTKTLGEITNLQSLTLRGSMIGRELCNYTELLEWFLSQKGKSVSGFSNVLYSGITTVRMAEFVKIIIRDFPYMSGLYNVSSIPISKYDLINLFKEAFEVDVKILKDEAHTSRKDLISDKFYRATGLALPKWDELIVELKIDSKMHSKYYKK